MTQPKSRLPATLAPLAEPRLRRLLAAQIPADLADWLDFVALTVLVAYRWDLGPAALVGLTLAMGAPYVLLGPMIGVLVDRWDLRTTLVCSNLARAVAVAAFLFAPNLPILLALVFLKSSVDAFFTPAKQAALPLLAPPDRLMAANGLSQTIHQLTKIGGPALGGALIAVLAPEQVFLVDALLSLFAAALCLTLPRNMRAPQDEAPRVGFAQEFREGFAQIRRNPTLAVAMGAMAASLFVMFLHDGLTALLLKEIGHSEEMFGAVVAASGGGGVLGALVLGQIAERRDPILLIAVACLALGASFALMGHVGRGDLAMSAIFFLGLMVFSGFAGAALFVPYRVVLQRETPPHAMGRVATISEAVTTTAMLAAPPLGALIATLGGIAAPYLLSGYALLACAAAFAAARRRRPATT